MNDCLPHGDLTSQRAEDPVRAAFARAFARADDLSDLSPGARRLLVEAATLFHADGSAATSVRDIVGACGLTPGAFYRHFASRDDLLHRLVVHGHDSLEARIAHTPEPADGRPLPALRRFVHGYVLGHLLQPQLARVVSREYVHLAEARREQIVARRRALRARLADELTAGARRAELQLIGGPHAATRTAVMILDLCSRTSQWYDPSRPRSEPPEELARRYVVAALRLVGAAEAG